MDEIWLDIPGYVGRYQVSNLGQVKSVGRCWNVGTNKRCMPERIMQLQLHTSGYMQVHFRKPGGEHTKFFIHRLVAQVFLGVSDLPEVNHKDRDKKNNALTNLEWSTTKENAAHWRTVPKPEAQEPEMAF